MWQIINGDVVYKPRTFDFVNPATGEIPDEKELFRQKQGMKEIEIRNLKQRLSSQAFAWIKVGTDNPDDPIVDRQVRRGPKGTFKLTYTGDILDKGPQSGPVKYKQGTPKPAAAIGPGKGSLSLETTAKADETLSSVENARIDETTETRKLDDKQQKRVLNKELNLSRSHMLAREELRKSAKPEVTEFTDRRPPPIEGPRKQAPWLAKPFNTKPPEEKPRATKEEVAAAKKKAGLTAQQETDRTFKGTTKKVDRDGNIIKKVINEYTPAKRSSTEAEVKKAIDSLDSNIEKLKKIIDKQPVNSRTEETARSLKRVEYMKLIKEAEYKDLMSRRPSQKVGTSVRPPSISKLQKEQSYLENRLSKIDEAIKENVDKYNSIKKYEYGKAAPKEELLKVIKSNVADKKFATEALKVVLLILKRGRIP